MEAAGGSMGCAVGSAGCPQPAAVTAVAEGVPPAPAPAGSAAAPPSSAASFAAAGIAGSAAAVGRCVVEGALVRHRGLLPLHGHMEGLAVVVPVPAVP